MLPVLPRRTCRSRLPTAEIVMPARNGNRRLLAIPYCNIHSGDSNTHASTELPAQWRIDVMFLVELRIYNI